jgi:adenine-specific DNA-methyltransferase
LRFIGSKERLLPFIEAAIRRHVGPGTFKVADLFTGTGSVSRLFKRLGNNVVANDNLRLGYVLAQAILNINDEPNFDGLFQANEILAQASKQDLFSPPYDQVLTYLNNLAGEEGFFFKEYSPSGTLDSSHARRYFSDHNAKKIDAIRNMLRKWKCLNLLTEPEHCLLLADLMRGANRVPNIAGTYGCFIKHWDARATKSLVLQRSQITRGDGAHEVFCADANALVHKREFDVLYMDPPYTWRHYGAYYHILETIAWGDCPRVVGRTGLRPWLRSRSPYCDRTAAAGALAELITRARARHLFLSYNDQGLISHHEIMEILGMRGSPLCVEVGYRRYLSNSGGTKQKTLKERLYYVET